MQFHCYTYILKRFWTGDKEARQRWALEAVTGRTKPMKQRCAASPVYPSRLTVHPPPCCCDLGSSSLGTRAMTPLPSVFHLRLSNGKT